MIAVIFTILANSVAFLLRLPAPLRPSKFPRGDALAAFAQRAVHVASAGPKRSAPVSTLKTAFLLPPPSLLQRPSVSLARSFQTARPTGLVWWPFIMMSALRLKSIQYLRDRRLVGTSIEIMRARALGAAIAHRRSVHLPIDLLVADSVMELRGSDYQEQTGCLFSFPSVSFIGIWVSCEGVVVEPEVFPSGGRGEIIKPCSSKTK